MLSLLDLLFYTDHFALFFVTGSSVRVYWCPWCMYILFAFKYLFTLFCCLWNCLIILTVFVFHLLTFHVDIDTIIIVSVPVKTVFGGILSQILAEVLLIVEKVRLCSVLTFWVKRKSGFAIEMPDF